MKLSHKAKAVASEIAFWAVLVAWFVGSALLLAPDAKADTIGVHAGTYHFNRNYNYNEVNPGVYYQFDSGLILGTYKNSYSRTTVYAGLTAETDDGRFAISGIIGTGYKGMCPRFCNALTPAIVPSMRIGLAQGAALRLSLPNLQGVHASLEYRY